MGQWIKSTYEAVCMKNYVKWAEGEQEELLQTTFTKYTCSECGYSTGTIAEKFNYCPICGEKLT